MDNEEEVYIDDIEDVQDEGHRILSPAQNFMAGTFAGVVITMVGHPFDTVKVRLQTSDYFKGPWHCVRRTVQKEGLRGLYKGMSSPLTTVPIVNAIVFASYGQAQAWLAQPGEPLGWRSTFLAGAYAGLVNSVIVGPVELIKTKLQLQFEADKKSARGPIAVCRHMLKVHGARSFFKGMTATVLREVPAYGFQFVVYDATKRLLAGPNPPDLLAPIPLMVAGGVGGFAAWVFSYPQDVVKSRIQAEDAFPTQYKRRFFDGGFWSCMKSVVKKEGFVGLWRGFGTCAARSFPANAAGFLAYEWAALLLLQSQPM